MTERTNNGVTVDMGDSPTSLDSAIEYYLWMSPIATILSNADDGRIYDANDSFCDFFGYHREELIGQSAIDLKLWANDSDRVALIEAFTDDLQQASVEVQVRTASGEIRDVIASVAIVESDERRSLVGQIYDITVRKETEDRLRLSARIAQIGYESSSFDEVLHRSLSAIQQTEGDVRVGYASVEDGKLKTLAVVGPSAPESPEHESVDLSSMPEFLNALDGGRPLVIPNLALEERLPDFAKSLLQSGVQAIIDVPVFRADELIGVLFIDSPAPRSWSDSSIERLTDVTALFSVSLFRAQAEEELRHERELMQTVMDHVPDFLFMKDIDSKFTRINRALAHSFGFEDPDQAIGLSDFDVLPAEIAERYVQDDQRIFATGLPVINALEPFTSDGTRWLLTSRIPMMDQSGRVVGIVGTGRDVSEQHLMEAELQASESRQSAILDAIPDIMIRASREGVYLDIRSSRKDALWVDPSERIGLRIGEANPSRAADAMLAGIRGCLESMRVVTIEYEMERDSRIHVFETRIAPCEENEVVAITRDVTERKMLEQRLEYQATHDSLTGLPNRGHLLSRIEEAIFAASDDRSVVGVVFIDLDDFKHVNDSRGHAIGDRLLIAVGERLRSCAPSGCTVARIAGDEFAVLHTGASSAGEFAAVANKISSYLSLPIRLGEQTARISASIGTAIHASGQTSAEALLAEADHSMYQAKRLAKGIDPFNGVVTA